MRYGLVVSTVAHAVLIAWGFFSLPAKPLDTSNIEQIPVDFVEIGDVTKVNKGVTTAALTKEEPTPQPAPKVAPEPPPLPTPAPPPPEPAPPPPPEPAPPPPAPATEPSPTPPPEKTAAMPPPPVPRLRPPMPKPAPKPPQTAKTNDAKQDMDEVAALLDKQKLEQMAAEQPSDQPPTAGSPTSPLAGVKMTADELDALRARLAQCWSPPLGWTDPAQVRVVLMLNLNPDGSVAGDPQVLEAPSGQYSDTAPESALRAVRRCAPYNLPAAKYDAWKQVKVTFDPKDMGAG
jgi:hypothetical protein